MKNRRPGGLFGDWRYGWEDTTLADREQAQNMWDLGKAQEEANEIAKQKLEQDAEFYTRLESAIYDKCSEIQEYTNIEKNRYDLLLEMKKTAELNDIFKDLDIDYRQIIQFEKYLNKSEKDINQIVTEIEDIKYQLKNNENVLSTKHITQINIQNIEDKQIQIQDSYNSNSLGIWSLILLVCIASILFIPAIGLGIYCTICAASVSLLVVRRMMLNRKLNDLNEELDSATAEYNRYINKCKHKIASERKKLNSKLAILNKELKDISEYNKHAILNKWEDFLNFRATHYNYEIEKAIKLSNIPLYQLDENDIKSYGTVADYKNYIENKLKYN